MKVVEKPGVCAGLFAYSQKAIRGACLFFFLGDVKGSFFGFKIGLAQVLSNDTHTEELNTAQKQNGAYGSRKTCHRIAPNQCFKEKIQDEKQGKKAEKKSGNGGDGKGSGGKVNNAVKGV